MSKSELRWCIDKVVYGPPTATDALEYAENKLKDKEEYECCATDLRLHWFKRVKRLLKENPK